MKTTMLAQLDTLQAPPPQAMAIVTDVDDEDDDCVMMIPFDEHMLWQLVAVLVAGAFAAMGAMRAMWRREGLLDNGLAFDPTSAYHSNAYGKKAQAKYQWLIASRVGWFCALCRKHWKHKEVSGKMLWDSTVWVGKPFANPTRLMERCKVHADPVLCKQHAEAYRLEQNVAESILTKWVLPLADRVNNRICLMRCVSHLYFLLKSGLPFVEHLEHLNDLVARCDERFADFVSPGNASYSSKFTAADLLEIIAQVLREAAQELVRACAYVSVLADESQDRRRYEQVALIVRCVTQDGRIFDVYWCLMPIMAASHSAEVLMEHLILHLRELWYVWSVDADGNDRYERVVRPFSALARIVGVGFDGTNVMSGCRAGLQTHARWNWGGHIVYVRCLNHRLQLVLVHSAAAFLVVLFAITLVRDAHTWVGQSAERTTNFVNAVAALRADPTYHAIPETSLKRAGDTRWTSNERACIAFLNAWPALYVVVADAQAGGPDSATHGLLNAMTSAPLIACMFFVYEVFRIVHPVSLALQVGGQNLAVVPAMKTTMLAQLDTLKGQVYRGQTAASAYTHWPRWYNRYVASAAADVDTVDPPLAFNYMHDHVLRPYCERLCEEIEDRMGETSFLAAVALCDPDRTFGADGVEDTQLLEAVIGHYTLTDAVWMGSLTGFTQRSGVRQTVRLAGAISPF